MKYRTWNRTLSAALAAALAAAMIVPASASGNVDYTAADDSLHTIRWMEGVVDPQMPSGEDPGDFAHKTVTIDGSTYDVLESWYTGDQGWHDLHQTAGHTEEEEDPYNSGYAAASANLVYWWMHQNNDSVKKFMASEPKAVEGLADPGKLYDMLTAPASQLAEDSPVSLLFQEAFPEDAAPDQLLDLFFNGYEASGDKENSKGKFKPSPLGGFFHEVFGKQRLTSREKPSATHIKDAIAENNGVVIALGKGDELRYLNVWGMETDQSGDLCALFVTDSQDGLGMLRYEASGDESVTMAGKKVTGLYVLSLGESAWEAYVPQEKPAETKPAETKAPETEPPETTVPETTVPETEAAPQWSAATYQWSDDLKTCTATRKDQTDETNVETESAAVTSEQTQAPSHKEAGVMTYTADFKADWAETQVRTEEIPKKNVSWNAPTYEWDKSMRICTAVRTAQGDPDTKETAEGVVSSRETLAPTCLKKGQTTYTAKFDVDWAKDQEKVLEDLEQLTPNWGPTEYKWSQDHKTCTAVRTCQNETDGSHQETVQGTVTHEQTKKPSSQKAGETTYTAKFDVKWARTQKETAADIPALGEAWGKPTYQWSKDMRICTATRVDQNDPEIVETAETGVTSKETKAPTCTTKGETTYTAKFDVDWAEDQTLVKKDIPKMEPSWGQTEYEWSSDYHSCTAIRTCRNEEGHVQRAKAEVSSERTKAPTMTTKGETTYTAHFEEGWADDQTEIVRDIPKLKDAWNPPEYEWSDDFTRCTATRSNQGDRETIETAVAQVSSKKTKAPTNNMKGETTFTAVFTEDWARTQTKVVANIPAVPGNPNGTPKPTTAPSWNPPTYEWSEDYTRCTASRSKKGDASTVDLTWATVTRKETKAPTCAKPGEAIYTAKFTESWAKDQTIKGEIPALKHDLKKVAEVEATAGKDGVQAHYECSVCGKLFADAKGQREVTRDQLILGKPSVSDGYAILNGVPEKDHLVAVSRDKFTETLKENPGSVGVTISVGNASVSYDKKDVESIVSAAGDNQKLQLEIYQTDSTDSSLTLDQIQAADRNQGVLLYRVNLGYVKNGKNVPIDGLTGTSCMVPYAGTDAVRIYAVEEDGTIKEVSGSYENGFVTFQGGNGLYMLSESKPAAAAPQKSGSKVGVIIWSCVLVVSGLLGIGLLGFYLYQKKLDAQEQENPHRFSRTEEPKPRMDQDFSTDQILDYDDGFMDDPELQDLLKTVDGPAEEPVSYQITKPSAPVPSAEPAKPQPPTAPAEPAAPKAPVSPVAPKAPMQAKQTIAEKTAEAQNHKHPKP